MTTAQERLALARAALREAEDRVGATRVPHQAPTLPVAATVESVLPQGLRRGQVVAVSGSTSLLLELAGQASREGAWSAIVGMPQVGLLAAARRGIELPRTALIPHPGAQAAVVAGACVDGMDVVLLGEQLALSDADRRRLAARARERGSVVLAAGAWQGAHVHLTVERTRWSGLGAGEGRLREREVTVVIDGRATGPARRVRVMLDVEEGALDHGSRAAVGSHTVGEVA